MSAGRALIQIALCRGPPERSGAGKLTTAGESGADVVGTRSSVSLPTRVRFCCLSLLLPNKSVPRSGQSCYFSEIFDPSATVVPTMACFRPEVVWRQDIRVALYHRSNWLFGLTRHGRAPMQHKKRSAGGLRLSHIASYGRTDSLWGIEEPGGIERQYLVSREGISDSPGQVLATTPGIEYAPGGLAFSRRDLPASLDESCPLWEATRKAGRVDAC